MLLERPSSPELAKNLPDYVPLSHDDPFLTAPVFDPEEFLLSRARTTLPELRAELRDYLLTLKEELVQLINNDYEAFISLSTDLRSEGSNLKSLRSPLGCLQSTILVCQSDFRLHLAQKSSGIKNRTAVDTGQCARETQQALCSTGRKSIRTYTGTVPLSSSFIDLGSFAIATQDIRISDTLGISALDFVSRQRR